MNAKLTLNINEEVITRAKNYAQSRHSSVSRLVEDYLNVISSSPELTESKPLEISPRVAELSQMFQDVQFPAGDYRGLLSEARDERFIHKS